MVLPVGFCSSVLALVSLQSFLFFNMISEISYILIFHLIMAPKCVLPALIPLNHHGLYTGMTHRHLQLLILKTCIHLLSTSHPPANQPLLVFLSPLKAPKPFSLLSLQLFSFGTLFSRILLQKHQHRNWERFQLSGRPGGTAPAVTLWALGQLGAGNPMPASCHTSQPPFPIASPHNCL